MKLIFAVLYVSSTMGHTRYYKTEGFYIYCIIRNVYTLMSGLTFNLKQYEKACFKLFRG